MIISNESMNFKDPKESDDPLLFDDPSQQLLFDDPQVFDDPQLFDDQLEVWTLIIEKSTVIPPSLMVLLFHTARLQRLPLIIARGRGVGPTLCGLSRQLVSEPLCYVLVP